MLSQAVTQAHLEQSIHEIFRGENIVVNARKKGEVKNPKTGYFLELDIWIPELKLAFEFQDAYHYATTWYNQNPLSEIKLKDYEKREQVVEREITLVTVPCWWDSTEESLAATVHFLRPDISLSGQNQIVDPIPVNPPPRFFSAFSVPDVGEMMLASFAESPTRISEILSPLSPWWLGEKYDGIRCIWNPRTKKLYNKTGLELCLSETHTSLCSRNGIFLDGEIWAGRGQYVEAFKVLGANDINWAFLKIVAFDNPGPSTQNSPFERRYTSLLRSISSSHPFSIVVPRIMCKTTIFLNKAISQIIEGGGEGVIMRFPKSTYERGRSPNLIKMKSSRGDTEALVVSSLLHSSKYVLQMPNGVTFEVDFENSHVNPKKGEVVTLEYESYSRKSAPVNPTLVRIRTDLRWEDVVAEFVVAESKDTQISPNYTTKPKRYWTEEQGQKIRKYFENYAKSRNLDPLLPNTWYSLSGSFISDQKDTSGVLAQRGGWIKSLMDSFPEIDFDEKMFSRVPVGYWENLQNRKQFFIEFAESHNFDPRVPENWYNVREQKELDEESSGILPYYQGSLVKALLHLFPDIGLVETKFSNLPKGYWSILENRKRFFDDYAKENRFDPLIASNWYSVTWRTITNAKGKSVLKYYEGQSLASALLDIYPTIGLERTRFSLPNNFWEDPLRRREFFDKFASENGFNPLVPDNWYSVSSIELRETKSYNSVVQYYKGGLITALTTLYPNIGLEKHKFMQKRKEKFHLEVV